MTGECAPAVIMVVDDVAENLKQLCELLEHARYRVMPAQSGRMALRAATSSPPDLILLDIRMPDLDGFEICARLKSEDATRDIPIIFISALDDAADKIQAFSAGGVDYVTKPFQHEEVLARIRTHLDLRRARLDLQRAHDVLEERVCQRTAELEEKTARLLENEEKFRTVADFTHDWEYWVGPGGQLLWMSPSCIRLTGHSAEEFMADSELLLRIVHPDDRHLFQTQTCISRAMAPSFSLDFRIIQPSGQILWLNHHCVVITRHDGTPLGRRISNRDITERKQAEETLRENESRLRSITNAALDAIVMIDQNGLTTFWNPAAERMFGYSADEAIGQNLHRLLASAQNFQAFQSTFPNFRASGISQLVGKNIELSAFRKDGAKIDVALSLSALQIKGSWHAVGILRDMTEHKRMQDMMMQTEKMMSIGGLAAGMAHEINNPLGSIAQCAQVLEMRLGRELPANLELARNVGCEFSSIRSYMEKRDIFVHLESIREAAAKASAIMRNMLEFSRRSEAHKELVTLSEVLDKALELASNDFDLKKKYDFKHINIVKDYDPTVAPVVCSRIEIEQVVLNLLKNAVQAMALKDFTDEHPTLSLRIFGLDNAVAFSIADNGPGMPSSLQKRIFEPFFTTKPVGEGTGLGLSVSYFIVVNNHGGTIEVQSRPKEGTCFVITLPVRPQPAP